MSLFILVLCVFFVANLIVILRRDKKLGLNELPRIELFSDVTIEDIYNNGKGIRYDGSLYSDSENIYKDIAIKGRRHSTFLMDKMPFQIRFNEKTELFGLGRSRKWILLANFFDNAYVRNAVAFYLERVLGEKYAMSGQFVNLYYNDENQGLYYLTPKVEIGKDRIDLRDPLGIVVEFDSLYYQDKRCYVADDGGCLTVSDLVSDDNEIEAMMDFMDNYNRLIWSAQNGDYVTSSKLADMESLAIYYLISEFSVNPDAYASSFYFYKDGANDVIHAGPGWDFDYAFGNRNWGYAREDEFYSPSYSQFQRRWAFGGEEYFNKTSGRVETLLPNNSISRLLYYLIDMPEFLSLVKIIYRERMMGRLDDVKVFIQQTAELIKDYAIYDNNRFNNEYFISELDELIIWITERFKHFDTEYGA